MSTEYRFSDPQIEARYDVVNAKLKELKDYCVVQLQELSEQSNLADIVEACLDRLEGYGAGSVFSGVSYDDDSNVIGVSTSRSFEWRSDNGFHDIASVEKRLRQSPQLLIKDEYDRTVGLSEFKEIVS